MAFRKINLNDTNTTAVDVTDNIIVLGKKNNNPMTDIGFMGKKSGNSYAGLIRDGETSQFYLIDTYNALSNNDVSVNSITSLGTLNTYKIVTDSIDTTNYTRIVIPNGTASNRPVSPVLGEMFFNTDTHLFEGWDGIEWIQFIPTEMSVS